MFCFFFLLRFWGRNHNQGGIKTHNDVIISLRLPLFLRIAGRFLYRVSNVHHDESRNKLHLFDVTCVECLARRLTVFVQEKKERNCLKKQQLP